MNLGGIVGLFADVHGTHRILEQALVMCRADGVTTIVLLGDLFDRAEQADACARALAGWDVVGVYGNHEREIALAADAHGLQEETVRLLSGLAEEVVLGDILLAHEVEHWGLHRRYAGLPGSLQANGHDEHARITFTGHTHYRQARDEHGPIDLGRGQFRLNPHRHYLINPGALANGQFAVWDRTTHIIRFRQVEGA